LISSYDWFATGHYAQIQWVGEMADEPILARSVDSAKDQTYYLAQISARRLRKTLFPIGNMKKSQVREVAQQLGLPNASRRESMGICFVGQQRRFNDFLAQYLEPNPGDIVDLDGQILGQHQGLWSFTVGQGARIPGMIAKMFVSEKRIAQNQLVVVPGRNHPALACHSLLVRKADWHWIGELPPSAVRSSSGLQATVQLHHGMTETQCLLKVDHDGDYQLHLLSPTMGVAPGQTAVIWLDHQCLGGGAIAMVHGHGV